jgi:hypothetical protein
MGSSTGERVRTDTTVHLVPAPVKSAGRMVPPQERLTLRDDRLASRVRPDYVRLVPRSTSMDVRDSLQSALGSGFRIDREIGGAGMSRVFLARDAELNRDVVVKVLPPELAAEVSVDRFKREIRLAASLQHPNIVQLLAAGELDGLPYYTMPYVDGESLRERLTRTGPMAVSEALRVLRDMARALAYAHRRGIVHRDVKPENVLLTDGVAVVTDFGIAKALHAARIAADDAALTQAGTSLGTPAYMAPEQTAGDPDTDHRADLYALGVVAYELLSGSTPFGGRTPRERLVAQMAERPRPIDELRPDVPADVVEVIARCLEKDPAKRPASAEEVVTLLDTLQGSARTWNARRSRRVWNAAALAAALVGLAGGLWWRSPRRPAGPALDQNVIAVLPFRVTAADPSHNYLREGVVDLLNARLTGDGIPRAIDSRTLLSALRREVKGSTEDPTSEQSIAVARRLGAGRVLLGEIVATRGALTASARLLRVPDGQVLAQHAETGTGSELEVVNRLMARLLALAVGEGRARVSGISDSLEAVKAYLAGMQAYRGGDYHKAVQHYQRALDIDSTFVLAALWYIQAGPPGQYHIRPRLLAWAQRDRLSPRDRLWLDVMYDLAPMSSTERLRAAERAARANPDRPEVLAALGGLTMGLAANASIEGALHRATLALDSAMTLDPGLAGVLETRLEAALRANDTSAIRRFGARYLAAQTAGPRRTAFRWLIAQKLRDSATLAAIKPQLADALGSQPLLTVLSVQHQIPLDDAERALVLRREQSIAQGAPAGPNPPLRLLAAVRGQVHTALANHSMVPQRGFLGPQHLLAPITLALVEPGYDSVATEASHYLSAYADTVAQAGLKAFALCHSELWRAARGDTSYTRRAISQMRRLMSSLSHDQLWWFSDRHDVCPLLLETAMAWRNPPPKHVPPLERLDSILRQGTHVELPGNVANLLVARWREAQGDHRGALAAVRRRCCTGNVHFTVLVPAHLREEGRLAAIIGDTAGAIRAYTHYLTIRDRPDPGRMADDVRAVRTHLAELTGESRRRRSAR